jgi:hypothetical protein
MDTFKNQNQNTSEEFDQHCNIFVIEKGNKRQWKDMKGEISS